MKKSVLATTIGALVAFNASADVVITEYVEGSGYKKAIELFNAGTETADLSNYKLGYYSKGSTLMGETPLAGTLAAGQTLVVVHDDAQNDMELPETVNQVRLPVSMNGDDTVALFKDGVEFDVVGTKDSSSWGKDKTFQRLDCDPSTVWIVDNWEQKAKDTFDDLGIFAHGPDLNTDTVPWTPIEDTATPVDNTDTVPWTPIDDNATPVDNTDTVPWTPIDDNATPVDNTDTVPWTPIDDNATPVDNTDNGTQIGDLQGEGWHSPYTDVAAEKYTSDEVFTVEGVVVGIQSNEFKKELEQGFWLQDLDGDGNPKTSDGIFVIADTSQVRKGMKLQVTANVTENYGFTTLTSPQVSVIQENVQYTAVPLRVLESDENFDATLERYEGMLVEFDNASDMVVTRTFGFDYDRFRNNMVVAHGEVNYTPNQKYAPNSDEALAQQKENEQNRIVVESHDKAASGELPWYPTFGLDNGSGTSDNYIRIGDKIDGLEGVVGYARNEFRFYVENVANAQTFTHVNDRTEAPVINRGDLTVGTFNVLNYFNSPFGGDCNPLAANPRDSVKGGDCSNRGASNYDEFEQQAAKIVKAIHALDADIIGLMEIENNGFGPLSAIANLVERLNDGKPSVEHYAFVQDPAYNRVGKDAIANQVIYKPAKVKLETLRIIDMPRQEAPAAGKENGKNAQRDAITPTFQVLATGDKVTVAVNHFKSKGSTCWEDVALQDSKDVDGQGSCENFRVSAAYHLGKTLENIEGYKLVLGDLNAYGSEDPISVLTNRDKLPEGYVISAARDTWVGNDALHGENGAVITDSFGYVNAVEEKHPGSYGYSFNDAVGTLDYILVDSELAKLVVDAQEWNINAVESTLFEYKKQHTGSFKKFNDIYRSSDHDPGIVSISFSGKPVVTVPWTEIEDTATPVDNTDTVPWTPIEDTATPVDNTDTVPWTPIDDNATPVEPVVVDVPDDVTLPTDVVETPEKPVAGTEVEILFDLTNVGRDLHVGDTVIVKFDKVTKSKAITTGGSIFKVVLTEEMIKTGYVVVKAQMPANGSYKMTKIITDIANPDKPTEISSVSVTVVAEDDTTVPTEPTEPTKPVAKSAGGSTGPFAFLALFGMAFARRRMQNK